MDKGDACGTDGANNNIDNKNHYAKPVFNTYNIADVNTGASTSDISITSEKIGNNTNNIGVSQLRSLDRVNKSVLGVIVKSKVGGTNNKASVALNVADKTRADKADIETCKKVSARAVTNTDNSLDSSIKVTDQYIGLAHLAVAIFATANCVDNSYLVVPKETLLSAITFIPDDFFAIFAIFLKASFEKKAKVYESNLFLFAANH